MTPAEGELAPDPASIRAERQRVLEAVHRADSRRPAPVRVEQAEAPTSLRSGLQDAFPWLRSPRGRLALWVAVSLVGSGSVATVLREQIRGWLEVPSRAELRGVDDRHAAAVASVAERVTAIEQSQRDAAERARREADARQRAQIEALENELRRAYRDHPGRPPIVMPPAQP